MLLKEEFQMTQNLKLQMCTVIYKGVIIRTVMGKDISHIKLD